MENEKERTWAERVQALVGRLGSLEKLAAKLEVSFSTVDRWKKEVTVPSKLAQLALENLEKEMEVKP